MHMQLYMMPEFDLVLRIDSEFRIDFKYIIIYLILS